MTKKEKEHLTNIKNGVFKSLLGVLNIEKITPNDWYHLIQGNRQYIIYEINEDDERWENLP